MGNRRTLLWSVCLPFIAAMAPAAESGRVFVKSKPNGAAVFLDDEEEPRGKTPCIVRNISTGTHVLRASLEGYDDVSQEVEVEEGRMGRASLVFAPPLEDEDGPEPDPTALDKGDESNGGEGSASEPEDPAPETDADTDPTSEGGDASPDDDKPSKFIHVDCPVCEGTGQLQYRGCAECKRTGYEGYRRCAECEGARKIEHNCPYCEGEGVTVRGGDEKDCSKCKGKGKLPCSLCRGSGKLKRANSEFSNRPTMLCPYCEGTSFESNVKCIRCSGKGTYLSGAGTGIRMVTYVKIDCPFCGGDGKGPPLCSRCRGAGVLKSKRNTSMCGGCFGTGQKFRPCRACAGKGWIPSR